MKPENKVYFGDHGITSTSANYLANLAKEEIAKDKAELGAATFLTVSMDIVGSTAAPKVVSEGKDEDYVNSLDKLLEHCSNMNSFCAWMREAIKAKEDELHYWQTYEFSKWLEDQEIIIPSTNAPKYVTEEDIIGEMNVKEREEYYSLDATAATYGQYIHVRGSINEARKKLHEGLSKPTWHEGEGMNTLIFNNMASTKPELVDSVFESLQNKHRSVEQRLNSIKAKIKEEVTRRNTKLSSEYAGELQKINAEVNLLHEKFRKFIQDKVEEVQKLKIVIPERLKSTHEYLNSLGKSE